MKKNKPSKKVVTRTVKHEIVVRTIGEPLPTPTESQLTEPMRDGKNLTLQKTWLAENQLLRMLQSTPREQIYRRKGRGGQVFDYVQGSYCIKWLNFNFGWNWDFEVINQGVEGNHIWVLGKLTVHSADNKYHITKTQYGGAEAKRLKDSKEYVDFGDDLKAASTDALKKCSSMLGFASDIYGKSGYKQETGYDPKPNIEPTKESQKSNKDHTLSSDTVSGKLKKEEFCYGIKGAGCPYGNGDEPLAEQIANYSKKVYKKPLCRECQKDAK